VPGAKNTLSKGKLCLAFFKSMVRRAWHVMLIVNGWFNNFRS
jgi:hypothetical protein